MAHIPFLIFNSLIWDLVFCLKITVIPKDITLLNFKCNAFWTSIATKMAGFFLFFVCSCFFKKRLQLRSNSGIRWHHADLEHSLMKERQIICSYVFLPIFMFWYSIFSFRNLKDANLCMFSWVFTTSSLTICSWHDFIFKQFLQ